MKTYQVNFEWERVHEGGFHHRDTERRSVRLSDSTELVEVSRRSPQPNARPRARHRARARMRQAKLLQPEEGCQLSCEGIRLRNGFAASLRSRKTRCLPTRIEVSELGYSIFG